MLKLNPKQQRQPYGGHHFPCHAQVFKGESFTEVVSKLSDFRLNNHIAQGNPEQEVLQFYSRHWPWMVISDGKEESPKENSDFVAWRQWVEEVWKKPASKSLTIKEARDRWSVCLSCPFNKEPSWKETKEAAEIKRRAFMLRRGIEVPTQLGFCALHKSDLGVFTFLEKPADYSNKESGQDCKACWVVL